MHKTLEKKQNNNIIHHSFIAMTKRDFFSCKSIIFQVFIISFHVFYSIPINKTNDLILNLTPENVTQHSRIE